MSEEKPVSKFEEVHQQVQKRLEQLRQAQEKDADARRQRANEESIRKGFDSA